MKYLGIKAISLALVFPLLIGCGPKSENSGSNDPILPEINGTYYGFNTYYSVKLYNAPVSYKEEIVDIISSYSALCDNYDSYPGLVNINTINNATGPVKVDDKLFTLLEKSVEYSEILNGYFNPLLGKLSKLWKSCLQKEGGPVLPDQNKVDELLKEAKNSTLILNEKDQTVEIKGGAEIDLGGIAKGYSLDLIKDVLDSHNHKQYLVNGGDSSIMLGEKPNGSAFSVGLRDIPKAYFTAKNEFISTSSMFVQGTEIDGNKYSHIINPFTGSALTELDLVMVKGPIESGLLDAMTTAFSCMSIDQVKSFEEKYDMDILIYDEGKIQYQSKNMEVKYH